ncbi:unnamed protein product [Soboliphyme baturini]|uniref:Uncharacterized protein n=1 Tax=Soboliphyme baturini TaxID=241478 RepID=A0A183IXH5_9BILA|nr:unnamed protein product [Soboliphyme baturini]
MWFLQRSKRNEICIKEPLNGPSHQVAVKRVNALQTTVQSNSEALLHKETNAVIDPSVVVELQSRDLFNTGDSSFENNPCRRRGTQILQKWANDKSAIVGRH